MRLGSGFKMGSLIRKRPKNGIVSVFGQVTGLCFLMLPVVVLREWTGPRIGVTQLDCLRFKPQVIINSWHVNSLQLYADETLRFATAMSAYLTSPFASTTPDRLQKLKLIILQKMWRNLLLVKLPPPPTPPSIRHSPYTTIYRNEEYSILSRGGGGWGVEHYWEKVVEVTLCQMNQP